MRIPKEPVFLPGLRWQIDADERFVFTRGRNRDVVRRDGRVIEDALRLPLPIELNGIKRLAVGIYCSEDQTEVAMKYLDALTRLGLPLFTLIVCANTARAAEISGGTITTTLTLFDDSELAGDVTCAVPLTTAGANPCIAFGVDHIQLRLNGHTITGPVTPPTGCSVPTDTMYGVGIEAADRTDVKIEGPGIIEHFERWGILLGRPGHPSTQVTVRKVTAYRNCWSGMQVTNTSESNFEENVFASDAGGSNGASCGGT